VRNSVRATQRELKRHRRADDLDAEATELADLVIARGDELISRFDPLTTTKMSAKRIRIHGDLHLGQILWTGHDVVFIDFEGEPGQPMGQRTIKRSPLGDVAGLLRSLDYAGRVAVDTAVERGRVGDADRPTVDTWRAAWTHEMQRRLLDAYAETVDESGLVPDDADEMRLLLDVYMVTKSLYEVRYELSNRPDWVAWPLHAVVEMLDGAPSTGASRRSKGSR
jgi:maltose alpha-D-glucosyltransferase/alpha-amylase